MPARRLARLQLAARDRVGPAQAHCRAPAFSDGPAPRVRGTSALIPTFHVTVVALATPNDSALTSHNTQLRPDTFCPIRPGRTSRFVLCLSSAMIGLGVRAGADSRHSRDSPVLDGDSIMFESSHVVDRVLTHENGLEQQDPDVSRLGAVRLACADPRSDRVAHLRPKVVPLDGMQRADEAEPRSRPDRLHLCPTGYPTLQSFFIGCSVYSSGAVPRWVGRDQVRDQPTQPDSAVIRRGAQRAAASVGSDARPPNCPRAAPMRSRKTTAMTARSQSIWAVTAEPRRVGLRGDVAETDGGEHRHGEIEGRNATQGPTKGAGSRQRHREVRPREHDDEQRQDQQRHRNRSPGHRPRASE